MKILESACRWWPKIKLGLTIQLGGIIFSSLCVLCSRCATGYVADRCRDGADVFTGAFGVGGGVKARLGPVRVGAFFALDKAGLRGGDFLTGRAMKGTPFDWFPGTVDIDQTISSAESFCPLVNTLACARGKQYFAAGLLGLSISTWPSVSGGLDEDYDWTIKPWPQHLPYYTQIEVAFGVGGTLRLGCNPGELLDFLLGWFGIDIFNDDIEGKEQKQESNSALGTARGLSTRDR